MVVKVRGEEGVRGDEVGVVPQGARDPGQLGDVEDDLGAVDVALEVAELAASGG